MPPAKAKKAARAETVPLVSSPFDQLTLSDLKKVSLELEAERARLARVRNQAQVDRDAVERFVEVAKGELAGAKHAIGNVERDVERGEAEHRGEVRLQQQRVKFLDFRQTQDLAKLANAGAAALSTANAEHGDRVALYLGSSDGARSALAASDAAAADTLRLMRVAHEKNLTKLRQEFTHNLDELRQQHAARLDSLRSELTLRHSVDVHDLEERRNEHIATLTTTHESAFSEMRQYYNDITRANLELIASLKAQISEERDKQGANQRLMLEIAEENKRLSDPLSRATAELTSLQTDLRDAEKDRQSLRFARSRLAAATAAFADAQRTRSVQLREVDDLKQQRDAIRDRFEAAVASAGHTSAARCGALEAALDRAEARTTTTSKATSDAIQRSGLDPVLPTRIEARVSETMARLHQTQLQRTAVEKAHYDTVRVLTAKAAELGIPAADVRRGLQ